MASLYTCSVADTIWLPTVESTVMYIHVHTSQLLTSTSTSLEVAVNGPVEKSQTSEIAQELDHLAPDRIEFKSLEDPMGG